VRRALALLLLVPALGAGCARQKGAARHGLPTGDGVWFEDGTGAATEDLEGALLRAGISKVFLPAMRLSRQGSHWEARQLPPPARPFSRVSVFLVIGGDAAVEEALGSREAVRPLGEALWAAVQGSLKDTQRYGPVTGVHLDFPCSARVAEGYETLVSGLRARMPRGLLLTLSLRFAPSAEERGQFKTLASACDGLVAFLFGEGNRAESQAVDALERDWWAGYAPSTRGVWKGGDEETRGSVPEWVLARLLDDPGVEFLQDVSLQEESDQTFLLRPRVLVSLGEGLSFGPGDRIFFRQPLISDMIFHLRSDLSGRRFARGRVVALPGRADSERLFTLAALGDVLAGKPAQPVLHVSTETGKNLVTVSAENVSPHATAISRTSNWVEVLIPSGGIRDVQPGGFDRFELYGRGHHPLTMGLATTVRFYEILIGPHEKIEPARIVVRAAPPKECCETRFHFLGASGQETLSDTLPAPPVEAPK
jgi:hypothetical protein